MLRDPCRNEYDMVSAVLDKELLQVPLSCTLESKPVIEQMLWFDGVLLLSDYFFWLDADIFVQKRRRCVAGDFNLRAASGTLSFPNRSFLLNKCCDERCLVIILSWLDADLFVQKRRQYVVGDFNFRAAPGISSFPLECCSWIALPLNSLMLICTLSWCVLCPRW